MNRAGANDIPPGRRFSAAGPGATMDLIFEASNRDDIDAIPVWSKRFRQFGHYFFGNLALFFSAVWLVFFRQFGFDFFGSLALNFSVIWRNAVGRFLFRHSRTGEEPRRATVEEIAEVPGLPMKDAEAVYRRLHAEDSYSLIALEPRDSRSFQRFFVSRMRAEPFSALRGSEVFSLSPHARCHSSGSIVTCFSAACNSRFTSSFLERPASAASRSSSSSSVVRTRSEMMRCPSSPLTVFLFVILMASPMISHYPLHFWRIANLISIISAYCQNANAMLFLRSEVKKRMSFSEQLRRARSASGRTQREIAEALHVTTSTYCGYETGKRQPDIVKLRQLSLLLHVSCDALLETRSESDADPSIDAQARRLLSIFSSLRPEYRSYALDQIQKLAELQNGSSQPIAPPSNP